MKRATISSLLILSGLVISGVAGLAQDPAPPPGPPDQQPSQFPQQPQQAPQQMLSPQDLDNLVAPVALYPDPVLGQLLAASTYPLELVEAQQWMQQNAGLQGRQRVDAARQQNWEPSVQAMVAFPDVLAMLNRDIRWTTDLGNAFLNQQADVMASIQRMRARAQSNGRLQNTPQQRVTTESQDGQSAIEIQPADPQVVYVPSYNPAYVWGPPAYGAYPSMWYPSFGFLWGAASFIGSLFTGFLSFGGWGWGLNWLAHGLFFNGLFFNHFGYHGFGPGGYGAGFARSAWVHDPGHRMGVAYPNRALASRYGGGMNRGFSGYRSVGASHGVESRGFESNRGFESANRGAYRGGEQGNRGYSNPGAQRGYSSAPRAPAQNFAARNEPARNYSSPQRSSGGSQHFSAPRSSGRSVGGGHVSAPHASGGHSGGGGHGGGHSSGHSGGGHKK
jgi:hypothetical protein